MNDEGLATLCRVAVKCRKAGAGLRAIAPMFGVSKSTLQRWWPTIESTALSQTGQLTDENAPVIGGELSHLGQATPNIEAAS